MKRITVTWHEVKHYQQDFDVPDEFVPDEDALVGVVSAQADDDLLDDPYQIDPYVGISGARTPIAAVCQLCGMTIDDHGRDVTFSTFCEQVDGGAGHHVYDL